jgi:hypothetical protein
VALRKADGMALNNDVYRSRRVCILVNISLAKGTKKFSPVTIIFTLKTPSPFLHGTIFSIYNTFLPFSVSTANLPVSFPTVASHNVFDHTRPTISRVTHILTGMILTSQFLTANLGARQINFD